MTAPDLIKTDCIVTLGAARHGLLVEVAVEIEALCQMMASAFDVACEVDPRALRGVRARLIDLANASIAALEDDRDPTEAIALRVRIALPERGGEA